MNIAIFTDSFYPKIGGTEGAIIGLATELSKKHNVMVVCLDYEQPCDDSQFCFQVLRVGINRLSNKIFLNLFKNDVIQKIKNFKPDIINVQTISVIAQTGIKISQKNNIPLVTTIHTKFEYCYKKNTKEKFIINEKLKKIVKQCDESDRVITVCNSMVEELRKYGYNGDLKVIRNGLNVLNKDDKNKIDIFEKYNLKKDAPILLYVGHIISYKNIEFLLKSFNILKQKNFNFQSLLVGDGEDYDYFVNMNKEMNLQENVIFTGVVKDKDLLSSIYSNADLFVIASLFDNDPLVVVESAHHKTPTLTIENTGCSERIKNNINGFISKYSEEQFAEKIIEVFKQKHKLLEIGEQASKTIPIDWSKSAEEYEKEFLKIIKDKKNKC